MFEVGRLIARIQLEGAATFGRDLKQVGTEFGKLDDKGREASTRIGSSLAFIGTSIIALVALAVSRFASFDKAMSAATTATGALGDEQTKLRKAALEAGATTVYTAEQSADAITELGRAGTSTSNILGGGLAGSLALAAAGQLEVADAASIAATAMTQFRLSGDKIPHLADLLAAGANKAQGGVIDLGMALKQSGLVASQMGLSIEDTIGTLTAFASAGLLGSDAGTSFRTMLLALATPTKQQSELMKEYGIEAYKSGKFVGIAALAEQLRAGKLAQATQQQRDYALGIIFGSDAIRAANVLYNEGAKGINEWTDAVDESGAAAKTAAALQDNLAGDVEKLGGAIDSALIQTGEGANGVLRDMVQWLSSLVEAYGNLDPGIQQFGLLLGVGTGALLLFGGMLLITIPKIVEFRLALATLNQQVPSLQGNLGKVAAFLSGPWGIALAAATIGVQLLGKYLDSLDATSEEISASLKSASSAAEVFATAAKGSDAQWWTDAAEKLGNLDDVLQAAADQSDNLFARFDSSNFGAFEALKKIGVELGTLAQSDLPAASKAFNLLAAETDGSKSRLWQLLSQMPEFRDELIVQATTLGTYNETMSESEKQQALLDLAMGKTAAVTKSSADAYLDAAQQSSGLTEQINELMDTINKANGVGQDAVTTNANYKDALADVDEFVQKAREGVEGYTLGLDESTAAGSANAAMLAELAASGQTAAQAQLDLTGDSEAYAAALSATHQAVYDRAIALGATADEAQRLADKVAAIPTDTEIRIIADTAAAQRKLDLLNSALSQIKSGAKQQGTFSISGGIGGGIGSADGNRLEFYAGGGRHENHMAQIARTGTTRVWAEPETEGELYAPLAASKRGRSLALIGQTVNEWGYDLVPRSGRSSSATTATVSSGGSPTFKVIVSPKGGIDLLRYIDVSVEEALDDVASELAGGRTE